MRIPPWSGALRTLATIAMTAVLVAACSQAAASPSALATNAPATDAPATDAPTTDAPAGCTGADVRVALNHPLRVPFYEQISDGGRAAAKDCGAPELQVIGPTDFNLEADVQAVRDALAAGIQGIALNSYPPELWVPVVEDGTKKDVPFVAFNAGPVVMGSAGSPLYVGVNEFDVGRALGNALADALGPDAKGDVISGVCSPGFGPLLDRVTGMTDALTAKVPGIKVSEPFDTTSDQTKSFTIWSDLVQSNPDALAFAGVCSTDLPSLVKVKRADANADYLVAGADIDPEALAGIEDGTALATVGQSPFMQGYIPVRLLIEKIAMGKEIPTGWIDAGVEVVTKDNAAAVRERENSLEKSIAFYGPKVAEIFANPAAFARPLSDLAK